MLERWRRADESWISFGKTTLRAECLQLLVSATGSPHYKHYKLWPWAVMRKRCILDCASLRYISI